jgi:hypothetical protein
MRLDLLRIMRLLPLPVLLFSFSFAVASASSGATVSFSFDSASSTLQASVVSPVGVAAAQIVLDIPTGIGVGVATETGFMSGSSALSSGTEYRWFQLSANGQVNGGLVVPITVSPGSYTISLAKVGLKDSNGTTIVVDTTLPIVVQISKSSPTSSTMSQASQTGQSSTTSAASTTAATQTQTTTSIPEFSDLANLLMFISLGLVIVATGWTRKQSIGRNRSYRR